MFTEKLDKLPVVGYCAFLGRTLEHFPPRDLGLIDREPEHESYFWMHHFSFRILRKCKPVRMGNDDAGILLTSKRNRSRLTEAFKPCDCAAVSAFANASAT